MSGESSPTENPRRPDLDTVTRNGIGVEVHEWGVVLRDPAESRVGVVRLTWGDVDELDEAAAGVRP